MTTGDATSAWPVDACLLHQTPVGLLLVDRRTQAYFRLSPVAAELASLLVDGQRTFADACAAIAVRSGRGKAEVTEALVRACRGSPATAGWPAGRFPQPSRISGSSQAFLPISASLQLTNVCNLGCSFCYASSGRPLADELSLNDWRWVVESLANVGAAGVTLTGGEPSLARGFPELLTLASRVYANVAVFTNAFRVNAELVELIAELGNVEVQVSIDGTAEVHDRLRARTGSFTAAVETLSALNEHGVPTVVSMTVMGDNESTLEGVAEAVAAAGASVLKFGGLQTHVGRGSAHREAAESGSGNGWDDLVGRIDAIKRKFAPDLLVLPWDSCETPLAAFLARTTGLETDFMNPGFLHWYVRANGDVTVCPIDGRRLGNVLSDPFNVIGDPAGLRDVQREPGGCRCLPDVQVPDALPPLCRA